MMWKGLERLRTGNIEGVLLKRQYILAFYKIQEMY
jgi:hypothetical protein